MPIRSLIVAVVLLAGLGGLLWWTQKNPPGEPAKPNPEGAIEFKTTEILKVAPDSIRSIEILRPDDPVRLERDGSRWRLTQPGPASPVDPDRIESILKALNPLSSRRVLPNADPAKFGLSNSAPQLLILAAKPHRIRFGDELPTGGERYAQVEGDSRVFILGADEYASLQSQPQDLRDKRPIPLDGPSLTRLEYQNPATNIALVRQGKSWRLEKPAPFRTLVSGPDNLIATLNSTKLAFVPAEEIAKLPAQFAAAKPAGIVTATDGRSTYRFEVRKTASGEYLGKSNALDPYFKLNNEIGSSYELTIDSFRDNSIFGFGFDEIDRIQVSDSGRTFQFERKQTKWFSANREMDTVGVQTVIDRAREMQASAYPAAGPNQPSLIVDVSYEGIREKAELTPSGPNYLVRRLNDPVLYEIKGELVAAFRSALDAVKPAAPPATPPAKK